MTQFSAERATAVIDTVALEKNFAVIERELKERTPVPPTLIATVKANAYGHGTEIAVRAFWRAGCRYFAVATVDEALAVRKIVPSASILILGYTPPRYAALLAERRIQQTVFSTEYATELAAQARRAGVTIEVHLKIDGGMCRLGFFPEDEEGILFAIAQKGLRISGLFTHFPCADSEKNATRCAFLRFLHSRKLLQEQGLSPFCHAAASAAALSMPELALDGVRIGLALYGFSPVPTTLSLQPALSLTAPVVQIHAVPKGTPIGYGGSFVTVRPSKIGTCPLGYADGLFRAFSGQTVVVLTKNQRICVPIAGRICMDQTMIDLTDTSAEVGDRVEFLADPIAVAETLHTIPYEILTAVGARVKRTEIKKSEEK